MQHAGGTPDGKGATGRRAPPANVAFGGSMTSTKSRLAGSGPSRTQPDSPMRARPRQVSYGTDETTTSASSKHVFLQLTACSVWFDNCCLHYSRQTSIYCEQEWMCEDLALVLYKRASRYLDPAMFWRCAVFTQQNKCVSGFVCLCRSSLKHRLIVSCLPSRPVKAL